MAVSKTAKLIIGDQSYDLQVHTPSLGVDEIDVSGLAAKGVFTFDPGFKSTACCESKITFIDGVKGQLLYRGYPIEQLAKHSDYMESCYLLLHGELPNKQQKEKFIKTIKLRSMLNEQFVHFFSGFRNDAHPMAIMVGVVGALSAFYHDTMDVTDPDSRTLEAYRLISKMPTIAAMCYKHYKGQPFVYPNNKMGYTENFLHMMFSTPCEEYVPNPVFVDAMDKIFLLHADHELNASTSTVRHAGSTGANPYACIASGISALWGPAHGGANEAALNMLHKIGSVDKIPEFIARAKDKKDPFRLMGFGHRVYKSFDPRAKVMRETCAKVLKAIGKQEDPVFEVAMKLEDIALKDPYFIEKKLYPNVDFYSGIIMKAIGIPSNMFTVIFALSRTVGWISHWNEMMGSKYVLARPRQLYTGEKQRDYKPVGER